jgi:single-strand DNA-binding protein
MRSKVILIGNAGGDAQSKETPSGQKFTSFNLATKEAWNGADGNLTSQTDWYQITCWRGLGEIAQRNVTKGRLIYVEGRLHASPWKDNDGNPRVNLQVTAEAIRFPSKPNGQPEQMEEAAEEPKGTPTTDDDTPF